MSERPVRAVGAQRAQFWGPSRRALRRRGEASTSGAARDATLTLFGRGERNWWSNHLFPWRQNSTGLTPATGCLALRRTPTQSGQAGSPHRRWHRAVRPVARPILRRGVASAKLAARRSAASIGVLGCSPCLRPWLQQDRLLCTRPFNRGSLGFL